MFAGAVVAVLAVPVLFPSFGWMALLVAVPVLILAGALLVAGRAILRGPR